MYDEQIHAIQENVRVANITINIIYIYYMICVNTSVFPLENDSFGRHRFLLEDLLEYGLHERRHLRFFFIFVL